MKGKLVLVTVALLLLGVMLQFHEVNAATLAFNQCSDNFGCAYNIQPVEGFWPNLTLPMYGIKHRFPADYSSGSLEFGDDTPLDATEDANMAVSTVPEFPPVLILPIFLVLTLFGVVACKKSASPHIRRG